MVKMNRLLIMGELFAQDVMTGLLSGFPNHCQYQNMDLIFESYE